MPPIEPPASPGRHPASEHLASAGEGADTLRVALTDGARTLGLPLEPGQIDALQAYLSLLARWNQAYNLTAVRDTHAMVTQHLLDCLAVLEPLQRLAPAAQTVLDVGSGGGLPGVVLAIVRPGLRVTCIDAVGKKAAFVQQVAGSLGLRNLSSQHRRIEDLPGTYDVVTARAFASLADFVRLTQRHVAPGGCWMAMKGQHPAAELAELTARQPAVEVFHVEPLTVPGLGAERCLVWMRAKSPSRP